MAGPAPYLFHLSLSSSTTRQIREEKWRSSKRGHGQAPQRLGRPQEHRSGRAPRRGDCRRERLRSAAFPAFQPIQLSSSSIFFIFRIFFSEFYFVLEFFEKSFTYVFPTKISSKPFPKKNS
jgi:hypothetical protein